jgi:hypothetical protein
MLGRVVCSLFRGEEAQVTKGLAQAGQILPSDQGRGRRLHLADQGASFGQDRKFLQDPLALCGQQDNFLKAHLPEATIPHPKLTNYVAWHSIVAGLSQKSQDLLHADTAG